IAYREYLGTRGSLFDTFPGPSTVSFPDVRWAGLALTVEPQSLPYESLDLSGPNATYAWVAQAEEESGSLTNSSYGCPFPWYLPVGTRVLLSNGTAPGGPYTLDYAAATSRYATYWNGTGSGSFTGFNATGALQILGPVNETV